MVFFGHIRFFIRLKSWRWYRKLHTEHAERIDSNRITVLRGITQAKKRKGKLMDLIEH